MPSDSQLSGKAALRGRPRSEEEPFDKVDLEAAAQNDKQTLEAGPVGNQRIVRLDYVLVSRVPEAGHCLVCDHLDNVEAELVGGLLDVLCKFFSFGA